MSISKINMITGNCITATRTVSAANVSGLYTGNAASTSATTPGLLELTIYGNLKTNKNSDNSYTNTRIILNYPALSKLQGATLVNGKLVLYGITKENANNVSIDVYTTNTTPIVSPLTAENSYNLYINKNTKIASIPLSSWPTFSNSSVFTPQKVEIPLPHEAMVQLMATKALMLTTSIDSSLALPSGNNHLFIQADYRANPQQLIALELEYVGGGGRVVLDLAATPTVGVAGQPMTFFASSRGAVNTNANSFSWNFGDSSTGTGQPVSHTFANPGRYNVKCTTQDGTGSYVSAIRITDVTNSTTGASINASITIPEYPLSSQQYTFSSVPTGGSGTYTSFSWNFGDGYYSSTQNPTHIYSVPGNYTIVYSVTDSLGATYVTNVPIVVYDFATGTPPSSIENLKVVPGNRKIDISWEPPAASGAQSVSISSYKITYNTANSAPTTIVTSTGQTSYSLFNLENNQSYSISVSPINSNNLEGEAITASTTTTAASTRIPLGTFDTVNGLPFWPEVSGTYITGIVGMERNPNTTSANLFNSPTFKYVQFSNVPQAVYRAAKRKLNPVTVGTGTEYGSPPKSLVNGDISVTDPTYTSFINHTYNIIAVPFTSSSGSVSGSPTTNNISQFLNYSGFPGDCLYLYHSYALLFGPLDPNTGFIAFSSSHDQGQDGYLAWIKNRKDTACTDVTQCGFTAWSYDYSVCRPFLLFDTRSITNSAGVNSVKLSIALDNTRRDINPSFIGSFTVHKVNKNNKNLDLNTDFTNFGTSLATIGVIDIEAAAGNPIEVTIDKNSINWGGYTIFTLLSSLDPGVMLPQQWNQCVFDDIELVISTSSATIIPPSPPNVFAVLPGNGEITCTWQTSATDGGAAITHYEIRNEVTGEIKTVQATLSNYSVTFTGLTNGTLYSFSARAFNSAGPSSPVTGSATPSSGSTATIPTAPINFTAVPADGEVTLFWGPPNNDGGSPLTAYNLVIIDTNDVFTLSPSTTTYNVNGLTNGLTYTFTVAAINAIGTGPLAQVTGTPDAVDTVPGAPQLQGVIAGDAELSISWGFPLITGGQSITFWEVIVEPKLSALQTLVYTIPNVNLEGDTVSFVAGSLINNNEYRVLVSAINAIGKGPAAISAYVTPNPLKVYEDFNYKKFFVAPVNLDISSDKYLEFLYPKNVSALTPAQISSRNSVPIRLGGGVSNLYLNVNSIDYTIPIPFILLSRGTITDFMLPLFVQEMNRQFQALSIPVTMSISGREVILTNNTLGLANNLEYALYTPFIDSANDAIFGEEPLFVPPDTIMHVENYVPTIEYDTKNHKALLESKVFISVKNKDLIRYNQILLDEENSTSTNTFYKIDLQQTNIKPKSVSVLWFNSSGMSVVLRDYLGDGRLFIRTISQDLPGDPYTLTYEPDTESELGYGTIDYKTGIITNIKITQEHKGIIAGKDVVYPVSISGIKRLYIYLNGLPTNFVIQQGTDRKALDIANELNNNSLFTNAKLIAGVANGQLYIQNVGDPFNNLLLSNNVRPFNVSFNIQLNNSFDTLVDNINYLLFGVNSSIYPSTSIFASFVYSNEDTNPYHHVWYQTPHFTLASKINNSQYITKAHLTYLMNKLDKVRPASTVLNSVNIKPTFTEEHKLSDSLVLQTGSASDTYLTVFPMIGFLDSLRGQTVVVQIINPDEQDIQFEGYTIL